MVLQAAIASYRSEHPTDDSFDRCLDVIAAMLNDPSAIPVDLTRSGKWHAGLFVIHYVDAVLDDHRIDEGEKKIISSLKYLFRIEEGDLLQMHASEIRRLLTMEMERILSDEQVTEPEAVHQSDLQRALDLGYDDYLHLVRESIRPLVDRLMLAARNSSTDHERAQVFSRLQMLQIVVKIDTEKLEAVWR